MILQLTEKGKNILTMKVMLDIFKGTPGSIQASIGCMERT